MAVISINRTRSAGTVSRFIYGHFAEHLGRCIYGGIYVGKDSPIPNVNGIRTDVVEAMKAIRLPVIRWPGGCFADEYHWRDGIGEMKDRKRMVNTNWGGVVEDNSFGTHEFLELCAQVGCEPYITGNVGSGTIREMSEWVEYINSDGDSSVVQERWKNGRKDSWGVKFWGVGNENWGCGGNMEPEYYVNEYRRYQGFCRQYGKNRLFKVACGPSGDDSHWTEVLMSKAGKMMDGLSLHHYTVCGDTWEKKGSATEFTKEEYYRTMYKAATYMEHNVASQSAIMDRYDPEKRVWLMVDEWGNWFDVEPGTNPGFLYQQNTMRDAVSAAIIMDIFNRHCDRVKMANIAQTVNVLQAIILTEGDKMVLTPTYYVYDLYKEHMDARELDCFVSAGDVGTEGFTLPGLTASASEKDGKITLTVSNVDCDKPAKITVDLANDKIAGACGRVLSGKMDEYNDFEKQPLCIRPLEGLKVSAGKLTLTLPACCVAEITLTVKE